MQLYNRQKLEICILIPCFNNLEGLIKSINSINYNVDNFIVIIVDDGSIKEIINEDLRKGLFNNINLKIIRLNLNVGITEALNKGLEYIYDNLLPEYIARLDCGDICSPQRFEKQISFFKINSNIHLLGSWGYYKDINSGKTYKYVTPTKHASIIRGMNFRNMFIHSSVMWRTKYLEKIKYPNNYPCAEDYGLFFYIISKVNCAILNEFLTTSEIDKKSISNVNRKKQLLSRQQVIKDYKRNFFIYLVGYIKLIILISIPNKTILKIKHKLFNK